MGGHLKIIMLFRTEEAISALMHGLLGHPTANHLPTPLYTIGNDQMKP